MGSDWPFRTVKAFLRQPARMAHTAPMCTTLAGVPHAHGTRCHPGRTGRRLTAKPPPDPAVPHRTDCSKLEGPPVAHMGPDSHRAPHRQCPLTNPKRERCLLPPCSPLCVEASTQVPISPTRGPWIPAFQSQSHSGQLCLVGLLPSLPASSCAKVEGRGLPPSQQGWEAKGNGRALTEPPLTTQLSSGWPLAGLFQA